ncbi:unnamed protein product [Phytomonas sp. Hart1]|nr:unnamed protein product [Phytomonas sp. Hart1]|eukprot:CCW69348.1 unnamed protein product [Phytomonas sp. isolate Hart1]
MHYLLYTTILSFPNVPIKAGWATTYFLPSVSFYTNVSIRNPLVFHLWFFTGPYYYDIWPLKKKGSFDCYPLQIHSCNIKDSTGQPWNIYSFRWFCITSTYFSSKGILIP